MSEEDCGGKMDKTSNQRQRSSVQKNYNELSKNQRSGRKRGNGNGGNFSYNEGPSRKPTPQKNRNTWDKRPRPRSDLPSRGRSDLEEDYESAEYGSAIQSGSKKGNLNHLLNFTFEERESSTSVYRGSNAGWTRGRHFKHKGGYFRGSKVYYNKETYLQANCQFLVKKDGDYQVHLMDPDVLVDWDFVEQVAVTNTEEPSCPICLQHPKAAKMTRCGHIFCWACILHYLALGEKTWRKCPICYESVHSDDLKSVKIREVNQYKVGDTITMTLMKKERGSIYAVPANVWQKQPKKCHNVKDPEEVTCHQKLLSVNREQVQEILETERDHLMVQQVDAEPSEEPFIKGALEQLKARQQKLTASFKGKEKIKEKKDNAHTDQEKSLSKLPSPTVPQAKQQKKIKQYKDAFDNEEEEEIPPLKDGQPKTDNTRILEKSSPESDQSTKDSVSIESEIKSPTCEGDSTEGESLSSPTESPTSDSPDKPAHVEMIMEGLPVEEAAAQLELPSHDENQAKNTTGDNCFYFYQAADGQHVYLHSLNARCLVKEYGSLENSPQTISGEIVEKESGFVSDELRRRLRYLSHLPVTCSFDVTELILKPPVVSKETLKVFNDDIQKRKRNRMKKNRDDKRIARKIEELEKKKLGLSTGFHVRSDFHHSSDRQSDTRSDTRSDTSSPSFDTPVGSPKGLNVHAAEFTPGASTADLVQESEDGSQTTVISFAQMIRGGTQSTVWPKAKTDSSQPVRTRQFSGSQQRGSDESDNEDRVPVPQFQQSFGSDIQAALENIERKSQKTQGTPPQSVSRTNNGNSAGGSGKKKKKQLMLFSTSMARGGN